MHGLKVTWLAGVASLTLAGAGAAWADDAPAAAAPTPLASPSMTPPLSANANPISADVPVLGKIYFSGQITGLLTKQDHSVPGNENKTKLDFSNAQIEVQKTDGVFQFYIQAGGYTFPSLGSAYVSAKDIPKNTFRYVPVAYVKLQPTAEISVLAGKIPTLIGAEYTFSFQNMNINRGLLWNQEPAISRGVQVNYSKGPLTVSGALTDGYYSNHYSTGSALVSYAVTPADTIVGAASINFSDTSRSTFVTPIAQNNGSIYNLIYTHTEGALVITPYLQYSHTPKKVAYGLPSTASTWGGAVLAKYNFTPIFSLAGRVEYEDSSGSQVSLLYGHKSGAWSATITPTMQINTFFLRGEIAYTKLNSAAAGSKFGPLGNNSSQTRAMIESGFLF